MRGIDKSLTEEIGARKNSYSIAVSYRLFRQPVWPSVKRDFNGSDLYVQNINPIMNYAAELDVMDGRQPFMTIIWLIELQMNMKIHCILRLFAYNVTSNRMFAFGRCCQLLFKCIFVHHKCQICCEAVRVWMFIVPSCLWSEVFAGMTSFRSGWLVHHLID